MTGKVKQRVRNPNRRHPETPHPGTETRGFQPNSQSVAPQVGFSCCNAQVTLRTWLAHCPTCADKLRHDYPSMSMTIIFRGVAQFLTMNLRGLIVLQ